MQTGEKFSPDWSKIKDGWVEGFESIRALGRIFGVSDTAIRKRAKDDKWPKRGSVRPGNREPNREPERKESANSEIASTVIQDGADADPKALVKQGRTIVEMLMRELRVVSSNIELIEQIIDEETNGDKSPKRRQLLMRVVSLPTRTQAARNLASALSILKDAAPGKKDQAKDDAESAVTGEGDDWGNLLNPGGARVN